MWGWSIGWACLMGHWAEDGKEGEGAKVVGMEKKGWAGRGRIVRTWGLTGCAGCRLSGIIPGFCEGGVGAESGRSGKRPATFVGSIRMRCLGAIQVRC